MNNNLNITIRPFKGRSPKISANAYIFENVSIYGDVTINDGCVIMPGCVIRSEYAPIVIGKNSNVQELTCIHDDYDGGGVSIGENVTIGHRALIHACTIKSNSLIGMGSIIQDEVIVGENCLIGAGAVVPPHTVISDGMLALGVPAKEKRPVTALETTYMIDTIKEYLTFAKEYFENR